MGSRVLCINLSIYSISHRICTWFCCALFCISVIYWVPVDLCYPYIHIQYDAIKWKHSPRYWPFGRVIHRSPVNSPHKGQWRGALMFALICAWINGWINNHEAGDSRRHRAHYDVIVMCFGLLHWHWGSVSEVTLALRWRHNGRDCVSNHQPHDCLLNRLFGRRSK